MIEEALESPAFYILSALGIGAEVLGWMASKKMDMPQLPFWQLIVMVIVTIIASAVFASKE